MTELAKGVRDFSIEEMELRNRVIDAIKEEFRLHGFSALETPIIERLETLKAKMSGSDETDVAKEIFRVEDQGGRDLGLRYDLTVPLARYIAMHKDLKMPFRRSEIGKVYRDGPIKLGRYREFVQCDADIIGAASPLSEVECLMLAAAVFAALEIPASIHVNDRAVLDAICKKVGVKNSSDVIIAIDKLEKIGKKGVKTELEQKGVSEEQQEQIFSLVMLEGTNEGKLKFLEEELGSEVVSRLREILKYTGEEVEFTPSLARGLAYYTGVVFEAFAQESQIKSSLMGGGRYDNLIGVLGGETQPAVGLSFGIEPICEVIKERTTKATSSNTKVFIATIGDTLEQTIKLAKKLREHSISCIYDISARSITKNLDYANKMRIPLILIVGEKDLANNLVTLKELESGDEIKLALDDIDRLVMEIDLR